jgi:pimeloyl-ACP methyl ester carboxylesterase
VPDHILRRYCLGDAPAEVLTLFRQAVGEVAPEVLANRLAQIARLRRPAKPMMVPALCLQATADRLVPARALAAFAQAFPMFAVSKIDGPHFLLQARPRECWQAIGVFLGGLGSPAASQGLM